MDLKPDKADNIKFMFDTFTKDYEGTYSDFAFCGCYEDEPTVVYPMFRGNLLKLREAIDSSLGYLRQNSTIKIMFSHDNRFKGMDDPDPEFWQKRNELEDINEENNSPVNIATSTFKWIDNNPDIVNHYCFVGICSSGEIVVVTSKKDELQALYCSRRLHEIIYQVINQELSTPLNLLNKVTTQIADETYDRVVSGILRGLAFFELSRQPLAFVSVISYLIDMIVYHNYPTLNEADREEIKSLSYRYMQDVGLLSEADVKKIEKQTKQTPLDTLEKLSSGFIKMIKEEQQNG